MSYILHAVYASSAGPLPIDYLINLDGGASFLRFFPVADPPAPIKIPGDGGSVLVPPPDATPAGVPEPATWELATLAIALVVLLWWARRVV